MMGIRGLAVLAIAAALTACATAPPHYPPPERDHLPPPLPPPAARPAAWSDLPGWSQEDHLAAMAALKAACAVARDPAMAAICAEALAAPPETDDQARTFLEAHFRAEAIPGEGVLTGYFAPEYEARPAPEAPFTAPVRARPSALDVVLATATTEDPGSDPLGSDAIDLQPDRAAIEAMPASDSQAWMRPEELFIMQIQGSGVLVMPDGRRLKAAFAGSNAKPFVGLARVMRQQGLIDDAHSSGDAIRAWLADHRGPDADAVMRQNPRYVYFNLKPDDGREPSGAAGTPLPPGRALAMDSSMHGFGDLYYIDARAPALAGAFPSYQRLAAALDVGGAIKGEVRADLYLGTGDAAGREAGRIRHVLKLYRLRPAEDFGTSILASTR